ncbi:E3 ubiquitin-protein ligase RNF19B isoform X4 [Phycodurus eques]|uniref:E3 ubiquitin-protein ligase RNF19B isoform X4 n=1 Tax=Phycodurus eques TaxID=693459 RepID=UPI002ACD86E1|nr:E3 ubiquitin-protein ligase RNF19B isoform X4 [Phycodurus eques]
MMETGDRERFGLQMGSEKDSEPSRSSLSGAPDPKCRPAGKRRRRVSFRSLFHGKRGSRAAERPEGVAAAPPSRLPRTRQQPLPSTALSPAAPAPPAPEHPAPGAPSERLSRGRTSLGGEAPPRDRELLECPLCLVRLPAERLPELLGCGHRSCLCCLRQYLRIEITESRVQLSCPECAERLAPRQVADILDDAALLDKYEEFLLRRCLAADPDCRWCPAPDCGFAVIASGCASCPRLACRREGCGAEFCYHCKQAWHPNQTCDSARQQRAQSLHAHGTRSPSYAQEQGPESGADLRHLRCFRFAKHVRPQSRNVRSLTALVPPQPVRLHLLGQEAVEQEEEDSVAAGHAHRRPRGHHAHRRRGRARHAHRHPRLRRAQDPRALRPEEGVSPAQELGRRGRRGLVRPDRARHRRRQRGHRRAHHVGVRVRRGARLAVPRRRLRRQPRERPRGAHRLRRGRRTHHSGGRVASAQIAEPGRERPGRRPERHLPRRGPLVGAGDRRGRAPLRHPGGPRGQIRQAGGPGGGAGRGDGRLGGGQRLRRRDGGHHRLVLHAA